MGTPVSVACVPSQGYPRYVRARDADYLRNLHKLHWRFSGTVGSGRPLGQEAKKRNDFYVRAYVRRKEDGADAGWGKMAREQPFVVSKALAASLASIIPA
jgi:hypothetical protein